jgi:hypothetical protein
MKSPWAGILSIGVCALPAEVAARTVKVCMADQPYAPFSVPGREAPGQYLVRQAIEHQGDRTELFVAPWRRCLLGVQA